jgi:hypothetical protein
VSSSGGFNGSVALTCAVINPEGSTYPPTCQIVEPRTVWLGTAATATVVINTTASAYTSRSIVERLSVFYGSVTMAVLVVFRPRIRWWKWQTLLPLLVLAIVSGTAIGCGRNDNPVIEPTGSGATSSATTAGNYIVAVTGTSGAVTATTAVSVVVN